MCTTPSSRARASAESRRGAIALLGAGLALALAVPALALESDREKDLEVFASYNKSMLGNKAGENHTLLSGNVRMVQGSLKAGGDEARLYDGDGDARRMVLTGKPAHLEQLLDGDGGKVSARAAEIDYNDRTGIAVLTGDVVVIQEGKSEFRGPRMTYDTNTGAMEGGSQAPGSEVRMIFKAKKPAPPKPASP